MKQYPKPLPIEAGANLYASPEGKRFYHLSAECPCLKYEKPQQIGMEQVRARHLDPCFFCAYEPPPPPTRKERIVGILTAPLCIFSLPAGITSAAFFFAAVITTSQLYHSGSLPLWATILVGAGIAGLGFWLDTRYGYIEW